MTGTSGLAAVTAEAGLSDTSARQAAGQDACVAVIIGAGEAEAFAVGADVARAVAADLAGAACGACQRRLLGLAVGRIGVGGGLGGGYRWLRDGRCSRSSARDGNWGVEAGNEVIRVVAYGGGEIHGGSSRSGGLRLMEGPKG